MSDDINTGTLVGRLVRDGELAYTNSGTAMLKISIASNKRRKIGDNWEDEAHYFDATLWAKRAEALANYMIKGQQVAVEFSLKQERWEKDGQKRSKVTLDVSNIQLLGGKPSGAPLNGQNWQQRGQGGHNQHGSTGQQSFENYTPPSQPVKDDYEDDIPF